MSSPCKIVFIVGDRFNEFRADKPNVMMVSEYWRWLKANAHGAEDHYFIPGQGLSEQETAVIERSLSPQNRIFLAERDRTFREKSRLTHKRKPENVVVSHPIELNETQFSSDMIIDDDCAEMADHCTGQHLQGMLIIEASRQMFIAVTETYFSELFPSKNSYFVINDFVVQFGSFAFPLPVEIRYSILEKKVKPGKALCFHVKMEFLQAGEAVSEISVKFAVYDQAFLLEKEQQKAQAVVNAEINQLISATRVAHGA